MVVIGGLMSRGPTITGASANGVAVESAQRTQSKAGSASEQQINELDRSIELTRNSNGYFYADVRINGAPVHMLVDTGATDIALVARRRANGGDRDLDRDERRRRPAAPMEQSRARR